VRIIVVRPTFEFGGIKKYVETLCFHLAEAYGEIEFLLMMHPNWRLHWAPALSQRRCRFHWSAACSNALDEFLPRNRNAFCVRGAAKLTGPLNCALRRVLGLPESDWHSYLGRQLERATQPDDVVLWCQPGPKSRPPQGSKPVVVFWTDFGEDRSPEYQEELRRVGEEWLPRAHSVVFLSRTVEDKAVELYPGLEPRRRKTILIPPWLPPVTDEEILRMRQRLRLEADQRVVVLPGRADERKGHLTMISAVRILRSKGLGRLLPVFCGPGTEYFQGRVDADRVFSAAYAETVSRLVGDLGWEWGRDIATLGTVSDEEVHALYRLSAVCVFPSVYEGLGLPILEAMWAGVPLVCSDIPVFREQLETRGLTAWVHPVGSAEGLAESLQEALRDDEGAKEMARTNRAALSRRTWRAFAHDYASMFAELASSKS
jgi:glycosyltransferase involved in cell wall biosynthesis